MLLQKSRIYERNLSDFYRNFYRNYYTHKIYFFISEERLNIINYFLSEYSYRHLYFLMRRIEVCEKIENYFYEKCDFDDYYDLFCNYCGGNRIKGCCDWGSCNF